MGPIPGVGEASTRRRIHDAVPPEILAGAGLFALFICLFEVLRLAMFLRNRDLVDASAGVIARSFLTGLRFDVAVAAYALEPLLILALAAGMVFGGNWGRRVLEAGAALLGFPIVFGGLAELEFYREFYARYNQLAVEYWAHPRTVASMIWHGYPVVRYALVGIALYLLWLWAVHRIVRFLGREAAQRGPGARLARAVAIVPAALLLGVAARGGVRGHPLQLGDAFLGDFAFANALGQNGFWTLGASLKELVDHRKRGSWADALSPAEARRRTQDLLVVPGEELVGDAGAPLLRRRTTVPEGPGLPPGTDPPAERSVSLALKHEATPPNVVLILMESFSARYVGAVGARDDRTPEFDKLAARGILFDRAFSNGSHTDQAAYCATTSFPNLPRHESLMRTVEGSQRFDSLASALSSRGYRTYFFYNGDLAWDNMLGFFREQGVDVLIGRDDFDKRGFFDETWGVSDQELFERADKELGGAPSPFFATILTLSNHTPFDLPRPLPFPEITDAGNHNDRMNGIRYADWSLGRFFETASREPWFSRTLFILVADHGFSVPPVLTDINLLRFHVPLLFYAPELLGEAPRVRHTVASHVDVVPTVLGLLGDRAPHQCWGRDLFALAEDDPGFAIFKPAGGNDGAGYARGDHLLVRNAEGRATFYRYELGFPAGLVRLSRDAGNLQGAELELEQRMEADLCAYIQTAREVLLARHAAGAPRADTTTTHP
jgi:phosphoglycerol transferase MdoB-like AlkP superfamily enzyme